jgi:hypothetical protein
MAQFSSIVGSILRDFTAAQHEANLCSLALVQEYRKNGKTKDFQLPNATIGDIELDIKYAIRNTNINEEQYEVDYLKLKMFFKEISSQLAKVIITSVISSVRSSEIPSNMQKKKFSELMENEKKLRQEFASFLGRKIQVALFGKQGDLVQENGELNTKGILDTITDVAKEEFLMHRDLDYLFEGDGGDKLREAAAEGIRQVSEGLIEMEADDFNVSRKKVYPSLDIIVAVDELQKLPEDTIHSIRFKVIPKYYSLVEEEDTNDFRIVAQ